DVRLAGVKVGTVTGLVLNPETYFADATISMRKDVALPTDSTILVSSEGLLGGTFVEVQPGGALEMLEPGGEIEDTQGAVSLITLLMKFAGGGDKAASDGTATP
ncbi:MAG: MlaD family protein, partial [Tabrizicola sp.]